ncbi:Oxidoreductase [Fusarium oxysporum f. sp. albedinis]|nr:Oxidoreductase [Fusarium oxysporum f. sp. albedinis]
MKKQKEHLLVRRKMRSELLCFPGFSARPNEVKKPKRRPLGEGGGNARRGQTDYWCSECKVPLCNNGNCWYFYHNRN